MITAPFRFGLANNAPPPPLIQVMVDSDVKGHDWNAQLKLGSPSFVGLNYFQSVTPHLSAGGEFFWLQVGDGVWDPDQATLM